MPINARVFLLLCLTLLFLGSSPSFAQTGQDGLTVNATAAFDGFYRPGRWTPIVVTVSNRPAGAQVGDSDAIFRGTVSLASRPFDQSAPQFQYQREVQVPPQSTQRFLFYARLDRLDPNTPALKRLQVRAENGKLLQEIVLSELNSLAAGDSLVSYVSEQPLTFSFPTPRAFPDRRKMTRLSPRSLPDLWVGYDSLDLLVIPGWDPNAFNPPVVKALEEWVASGGRVLFLTGSNTPTYTAVEDNPFFPATVSATARVVFKDGALRYEEVSETANPLTTGNAFVAARLSAKEGTETLLAAADGSPLYVRRPHGNGYIFMAAFDFANNTADFNQQLMDSWFATMPVEDLMKAEYNYAKVIREGTTGDATSSAFRILTSRAGRPPNGAIIAFICILYALVVGPLNFRLLAKMKRFDFAWVTVPAIVVLFSATIYGIGKLTRGGTSMLRELTVLETQAGQTFASAHTTAAIFAPDQGSYAFSTSHANAAVADEFQWDNYVTVRSLETFQAISSISPNLGSTGAEPIIRTSDTGISIARWDLRPYDVVTLQSRHVEKLPGPLEASLTWTESNRVRGFTGTITNRTGMDFSDAFLVLGGQAANLGPLPNGRAVELDASQRPFEQKSADLWVKRIGDLQREIATIPIPNDPAAAEEENAITLNRANASTVLRALFYPPLSSDRIFRPREAECLFIGFAENAAPSIGVNEDIDETGRGVLAIVRVPFAVAGGQPVGFPQSAVSNALARYERLDSQAGRGFFGEVIELDSSGRAVLDDEAIELTVQLPLPKDAARAWQLRPIVEVTRGKNDDLNLLVYDFGRGQWLKFPHRAGATSIEPMLANIPLGTAPPKPDPNRPDIVYGTFVLPSTQRLFMRLEVRSTNQPTGPGGANDSILNNPVRVESLFTDRSTKLGGV